MKCRIHPDDHSTVPGVFLGPGVFLVEQSGQPLHAFHLHFVAHASFWPLPWPAHQPEHFPVTKTITQCWALRVSVSVGSEFKCVSVSNECE